MTPERHAWVDASAGVAGDMLLGALVGAGANLRAIQRCVDAVIPGSVRLTSAAVTRAGIAATKVDVEILAPDPPHRTWRSIQTMISDSQLPDRVRNDALAVFARLAEAEGRVHGVPADEIHFHEVGALDSIADVVGVCAAVHDLAIDNLSAGEVAVGSGHIDAAHGRIPVPVPAVTQLAAGWRITAGGSGELTTPTGMALVATLCTSSDLPLLTLTSTGTGAGTKDFAGRANVTRVLVGTKAPQRPPADGDRAVQLEANIDDLDPRLWPGVLSRLLDAGASDAWLVPILMKKGRPAHTLSVLCHPTMADGLREVMLLHTTTIGVRQHELAKHALPRAWVDLQVGGGSVPVKITHRDGVIVGVSPEFDPVAALAATTDQPVHAVLNAAAVAAATAGLVPGAPLPTDAGPSEDAGPTEETGPTENTGPTADAGPTGAPARSRHC
ncbi:MAG TPA: nickel pincer cofactor biosynthesis protein LarC [Propionibacteriaceae bacterium]|nr:nickel pincer cofactor biosynthesis protein LarC [Propionibacteriaceae bacterium]